MNKGILGILLAVNAVLLVALAVTNLAVTEPAMAQFGMRGDYVMIAGDAAARSDQQAVFILDLKTQKMLALMFDTRNNKLQTIAGRVVGNDMKPRRGR